MASTLTELSKQRDELLEALRAPEKSARYGERSQENRSVEELREQLAGIDAAIAAEAGTQPPVSAYVGSFRTGLDF